MNGENSVYDYTVTGRKGVAVSLRDYSGKVLLIVNTATRCGFTPQYEELEALYKAYRDKGFEILDFPCNQFGQQAPGTEEEIQQFCTLNFGTEFPQFRKVEVNGPNAEPLFTFLKSQKGFQGFGEGEMADKLREVLPKFDPDYENNAEIKWNFTKFVIDREGNVIARFEPTANIGLVAKCISSLL